MEVLRQLLTRGSLLTSLGGDHLTHLQNVAEEQETWTKDVQNLGFITNLGYDSYPAPYGQPPRIQPVSEDIDETPTRLKDLGLTAPPPVSTVSYKRKRPEPRREPVRLPKAKKVRKGKPTLPELMSSDAPVRLCPVCKWQFPATYTDLDLRRHHDLSLLHLCSQDIIQYRESQRALKKRLSELHANQLSAEQNLTAHYGNVRLCPHCKRRFDSSTSPSGKKTHIDACSQTRMRHRTDMRNDDMGLGIPLLKKPKIAVQGNR